MREGLDQNLNFQVELLTIDQGLNLWSTVDIRIFPLLLPVKFYSIGTTNI